MKEQRKKRYRYDEIYRTTFDKIYEEPIPNVGIYVLAYMGVVLYIGKTEASVSERLNQHMRKLSRIGAWLLSMEFDWKNIRLDIIVPELEEKHGWFMSVERKLINHFNPLFNDMLVKRKTT